MDRLSNELVTVARMFDVTLNKLKLEQMQLQQHQEQQQQQSSLQVSEFVPGEHVLLQYPTSKKLEGIVQAVHLDVVRVLYFF